MTRVTDAAAEARTVRVAVVDDDPRVRQTLRITSLDTRIPVFDSVSQALAAPQTA